MTLLLALAIGLAELQHGAGAYTVFPDDVRAQYVAWAMSLHSRLGVFPDTRPLEDYR